MPAPVNPFKRLTEPALVPVAATASWFAVANGFIPTIATSFRIANPNKCWVRLKGYPTGADGSERVTSTTGWLFAPGSVEVYLTQNPAFMSALAFDTPAFPISGLTFLPLEISYGIGA